MLIPRFSIRWLLLLTTVCAAFFFFLTFAVRGEAWAMGVTIGVGSLSIVFMVHALFFMAVWVMTEVVGQAEQTRRIESPFATEKPPPQIVTPSEPEG